MIPCLYNYSAVCKTLRYIYPVSLAEKKVLNSNINMLLNFYQAIFSPFTLLEGYGGREVRRALVLLSCQACELFVQIPPATINNLFFLFLLSFSFLFFFEFSFLYFTFLLFSFFPIQLYLKKPEIISTESPRLSIRRYPGPGGPDFFVILIVIRCLYDMNTQLYAKA